MPRWTESRINALFHDPLLDPLRSVYDQANIGDDSKLAFQTSHLHSAEQSTVAAIIDRVPVFHDSYATRDHNLPIISYNTLGWRLFDELKRTIASDNPVRRFQEAQIPHILDRYKINGNRIYSITLNVHSQFFSKFHFSPESVIAEFSFLISMFHNFPCLDTLHLKGIPFQSFDNFPSTIQRCSIAGHRCRNFTGLESMPLLKWFSIKQGTLRTLWGGPATLSKLEFLEIQHNPLRAALPCPSMPHLRFLDISHTAFPNHDYTLRLEQYFHLLDQVPTSSGGLHQYISPHCSLDPSVFEEIWLTELDRKRLPLSYQQYLPSHYHNPSMVHAAFDPTPLSLVRRYLAGEPLSPFECDRIVYEGDFECFRLLIDHRGPSDPITTRMAAEFDFSLKNSKILL